MSSENQDSKKRDKKTEVIELRLSPDDKAAFMEACRKEGQSASSVLRDGIQVYLSNGYFGENRRSYKMAISGFIIGALAVTGVWGSSMLLEEDIPPIAKANFALKDKNGDGYISLSEYIQNDVAPESTVRFQPGTVKFDIGQKLDTSDPDFLKKFKEALESKTGEVSGSILTTETKNLREPVNTACRDALIAQQASKDTLEFSQLDKSSDNRLTLSEFRHTPKLPKREWLQATFNQIDLDKNGTLTRAEFKESKNKKQYFFSEVSNPKNDDNTLPQACDNGLGKVTSFFVTTKSTHLIKPDQPDGGSFQTLDQNNDGEITLNEYLRAKGFIA